ncbi:DUF5685 family protein [Kitasatospora misakiensis]|uniref:DUF5685 family protein n=1 Tax=Kitasatospora misakiensis TaxID=67330 RepID=A0ABW0X1S5_9ACTN
MFGIIRPCRHRLSERLQASWMAHLCGLCLALRDDHGQLARTATNYDGLIISVLVEAQADAATGAGAAAGRRTAGPCPLRGMRTASVARGEGARLAATVSLALASVKIRDHVEDRDGVFARRSVAAGARAVTRRWDRKSAGSASVVGFDTAVLLDAAARQGELERALPAGGTVLLVTEPTETATAAAFAHTAVLAGRPGNEAPLAEAGRLFGRLAHLLDAAEDQEADALSGAWNPLTATGTDRAEAARLCRDAVHGIRLALRDVELADRALVHILLAHETERAVERVFGRAGHTACRVKAEDGAPLAANPYQSPPQHDPSQAPPQHNPYQTPPQGPGAPVPPWIPQGPGFTPPGAPPPNRRNLLAGCAAWALLGCTCQLLCCEHDHPFSGERREGFCARNDCCDCGNCCDGCQCCGENAQCCSDCGCCDGCDGCDCGCDC